MKTKPTPLTTQERSELNKCEETLSREDKHFVEVGNALLKMKEAMLYRENHSTFERYARERWDMSRAYAYQKIKAANVVTNLSAVADILPINEAQARPLSRLTPDEQRQVWSRVLAETKDKPTAKVISEIAVGYRPEPVAGETKESRWEAEKRRADALQVKVTDLEEEVSRLKLRVIELEALNLQVTTTVALASGEDNITPVAKPTSDTQPELRSVAEDVTDRERKEIGASPHQVDHETESPGPLPVVAPSALSANRRTSRTKAAKPAIQAGDRVISNKNPEYGVFDVVAAAEHLLTLRGSNGKSFDARRDKYVLAA